RMVPIELRLVKEKFYALTVTFVGEHFDDVLLVGGAVNNVIIRYLAVEHRESVVIRAGYRDIYHAGGLCHIHPVSCIECRRVHEIGKLLVGSYRDLLVVHHPFTIAKYAVYTPVNEQAESGILKPLTRCEVLR